MKIDLHCHSKASKRATIWIMQKLGCPESFTEPSSLYRTLLAKGCDWVTITDHNTIDSCLEIAEYPNTFIGCEYTVYFPEDRCKIHVLAHGITEEQHRELSRVRENVHDFVAYARAEGIQHACAHPLVFTNDRFTPEHVEKILLLFKTLELNGETAQELNRALLDMVRRLTPGDMARLSDKHGIEPAFDQPWLKNLISGSDDHSSLGLGSAWTEVRDAQNLGEFWAAVNRGQAVVSALPATPQRYARNVYGIAYQFYRSRFQIGRHKNRDIFVRFLERMLYTEAEEREPLLGRIGMAITRRMRSSRSSSAGLPFTGLVRHEADKMIREDVHLMAIVAGKPQTEEGKDQRWFDFVDRMSSNLLRQLGNTALHKVLNASLLGLFESAGSGAALYAMMAPYFIGYSLHARERQTVRTVADTMRGGGAGTGHPAPRLAHFTDTLHEVNGVARTLNQQARAAMELGKDYTVIAASPGPGVYSRGIHYFEPVGACALPEYPAVRLPVPPLLRVLDHCHREGFTHIHISTPGPFGLAGLAVAAILRLPVSATYHTAFPQYARTLTEDAFIEDLFWRFMVWFYSQMDSVFVPSQATADELAARGLNPEHLRVYPRGVDTARFHPGNRDEGLAGRLGIRSDLPIALYVGRISKEKNLHVLVSAFQKVSATGPVATLVVAGDGPYREEMERQLAGTPAHFTGYVEGGALDALYASSAFLVFPSATDTFGNVVLEAHASGIPAIVSDAGGPCENVEHGATGLVVEAGSVAALAGAIETLAADASLCAAMGARARETVESRGFSAQFERLWEMYVSPDLAPPAQAWGAARPFSPFPRGENGWAEGLAGGLREAANMK